MQRSAIERVFAFATRHELRAAWLGAAVALAGCSDVSETLWPSMNAPDPRGSQAAAATPTPAPAANSPSFTPAPAPAPAAVFAPPVPSGQVQTDVGQRARQLREEAQRLLNSVLARGNRIQQIRGEAVQHVQGYQSSVGAINARLAVGTTAGNPVLQQQLQQASQQLDLINGDVNRLNALNGEIATDSNAGRNALTQVGRAFSLPGAVEDDHRFLVNAEDDINRAIVLNNRQQGEVNADTQRLTSYVSRERPNISQLASAIQAGQLGGGGQVAGGSRIVEQSTTQPRGGINSGPLGGVGSARQAAPSRAQPAAATSLSTARRPLVTIRFDRPNPAYEQPLYTAVSRALERKPSATFDLVAMAPSSGRQAGTALNRARADAQRVLRTLTDMGLPQNRISVSSGTSPSLASNEVHLYVR